MRIYKEQDMQTNVDTRWFLLDQTFDISSFLLV